MTVPAYARSPEVARTLHRTLGPWLREQGWKRRRTPSFAYVREEAGRGTYALFWAGSGRWGNALWGNEFHVELNRGLVAPDAPAGHASRLLAGLTPEDRAEGLQLLRRIAASVPPLGPELPGYAEVLRSDAEGGFLRRSIEGNRTPPEDPWRRGTPTGLNYYSVHDIELWTEFLRPRLDRLLAHALPHPTERP